MRRLVSIAALAALSACAESPAPSVAKPDTVSYLLRDHAGTVVQRDKPSTGRQHIYYTTHHVHPDGVSNPVTDRVVAVVFGWGTLGAAADPASFPPKR